MYRIGQYASYFVFAFVGALGLALWFAVVGDFFEARILASASRDTFTAFFLYLFIGLFAVMGVCAGPVLATVFCTAFTASVRIRRVIPGVAAFFEQYRVPIITYYSLFYWFVTLIGCAIIASYWYARPELFL